MSDFTGSTRVAAVQFGVGTNVDENLATCVEMIGRAAEHEPKLAVLPEYCNHISWYDGPEHCAEVSVDVDGPFVAELARAVRQAGFFAVINCTVRRDGGVVAGTSLLFDPRGEVIAEAEKQVLIGHENDFLRPAQKASPIVETPIGRLAMYACMDGVIAETPRCLALRGADILCNSLNSFAIDEGTLHIPVRAAENRLYVVAANKVGPLIPEEQLEPVSSAISIPVRFLRGAGDSQIVAPDGTVLARASETDPEIIVADIDVARARDKRRPCGTDVFASRRPDLYAPVASAPVTQQESRPAPAEKLAAAAVQLSATGPSAIAEARETARAAFAAGARLLVFPELFAYGDDIADATAAASIAADVIGAIAAECPADGHAVVSLAMAAEDQLRHRAVVIGADGVVDYQDQLHPSARHPWAAMGTEVRVVTLPWGRLAIAPGDDALYPELSRVFAIAGADVLAVPFAATEAWETRTGLVERAAENRMNLVAATRPNAGQTSRLASLQTDFTLMTPWAERPFDGLLSQPVLTHAPDDAGFTVATLFPSNSLNKVVSHRTDLLRNRPWHLAETLIVPTPGEK